MAKEKLPTTKKELEDLAKEIIGILAVQMKAGRTTFTEKEMLSDIEKNLNRLYSASKKLGIDSSALLTSILSSSQKEYKLTNVMIDFLNKILKIDKKEQQESTQRNKTVEKIYKSSLKYYKTSDEQLKVITKKTGLSAEIQNKISDSTSKFSNFYKTTSFKDILKTGLSAGLKTGLVGISSWFGVGELMAPLVLLNENAKENQKEQLKELGEIYLGMRRSGESLKNIETQLLAQGVDSRKFNKVKLVADQKYNEELLAEAKILGSKLLTDELKENVELSENQQKILENAEESNLFAEESIEILKKLGKGNEAVQQILKAKQRVILEKTEPIEKPSTEGLISIPTIFSSRIEESLIEIAGYTKETADSSANLEKSNNEMADTARLSLTAQRLEDEKKSPKTFDWIKDLLKTPLTFLLGSLSGLAGKFMGLSSSIVSLVTPFLSLSVVLGPVVALFGGILFYQKEMLSWFESISKWFKSWGGNFGSFFKTEWSDALENSAEKSLETTPTKSKINEIKEIKKLEKEKIENQQKIIEKQSPISQNVLPSVQAPVVSSSSRSQTLPSNIEDASLAYFLNWGLI